MDDVCRRYVLWRYETVRFIGGRYCGDMRWMRLVWGIYCEHMR
jgi:hypothetical protein